MLALTSLSLAAKDQLYGLSLVKNPPTRAALFEAVACDRALYFDAARRLGAGVLPAEAAPAAERRSLAEQLGEATRVRPVCGAARAPVYSARYSDLKNIW